MQSRITVASMTNTTLNPGDRIRTRKSLTVFGAGATNSEIPQGTTGTVLPSIDPVLAGLGLVPVLLDEYSVDGRAFNFDPRHIVPITEPVEQAAIGDA